MPAKQRKRYLCHYEPVFLGTLNTTCFPPITAKQQGNCFFASKLGAISFHAAIFLWTIQVYWRKLIPKCDTDFKTTLTKVVCPT